VAVGLRSKASWGKSMRPYFKKMKQKGLEIQ
jgi:hypothetical protein